VDSPGILVVVGHWCQWKPLTSWWCIDRCSARPVAPCCWGYDSTPRRHQFTELPLVKATVTEHQVHGLICPCCGATNQGTLPPDVAPSQFGPNLVSLMAVLMRCYRLSKRQIVDVVGTCFGVPVAASSMVNQQQVISAALAMLPALTGLNTYRNHVEQRSCADWLDAGRDMSLVASVREACRFTQEMERMASCPAQT
jgi:hypothetical protein